MTARSSLRKVAYAACCLLAIAALLELVLQVASFAVWTSAARDRNAVPGGSDDQAVVLTIGDSYTYGVGASSAAERSYPAALERQLHLAGIEDVTVVNAGWPGRNLIET